MKTWQPLQILGFKHFVTIVFYWYKLFFLKGGAFQSLGAAALKAVGLGSQVMKTFVGEGGEL